MSYKKLENNSVVTLRKLAKDLKIPKYGSLLKDDLVKKILEIQTQKKSKTYKKIKQLGLKGKEGQTFLVKDRRGREFAMKTFSQRKSPNTLSKEVKLQQKAGKYDLSPKIYDYNLNSKYIVMEKLDKNFFDIMNKNSGRLPVKYQSQVINIFKKLDEIGVFHGDPNPLNFMIRKEKVYILDFGFAKDIDNKIISKYKSKTPNLNFMVLGFILRASKIFKRSEPIKYEYLRKFISPTEQKMFNI